MAYNPNNGFDTSALGKWIKESTKIVENLYYSSTSFEYFLNGANSQVGNKPGTSAINLIEHSSFLTENQCGRSLYGTTPLKTEYIDTIALTDQQLYCTKDLEGTFMNWALKNGANPANGFTNEFFQELITGKLNAIGEQIEFLTWQGQAGIDPVSGILEQITQTITPIGNDIVELLQSMWGMADTRVTRHPETRLHIGPDLYNMYMAALANKNIFKSVDDLTIYGTSGKMLIDDGLVGSGKVSILNRNYVIVSTDLSSDMQNVEFSYSLENRGYYLDTDFSMGVKLVRPDLAYVANISAALLPIIATQPVNQSIDDGDTVTVSVVASNATSYQWQVNTGSGFTNISGATSASYTSAALTTADNGIKYRVIISNTHGNIVSNEATITVA